MWSRMNAWLVVATCGMGMPTAGVGQERVRVTLPGEAVVGVVTRMNPDVLELGLSGGASRVISRDDVLGMERSFVPNQWHWGYLLGSVAGYGAGVAAFFAVEDDLDDNAVFVTPLGLIAGGIAGSWIGASRKRAVWKPVPEWTGDRVRVTLSDSERIVGSVSRVARDGLEVLLPRGPRLVAMGDVARIERRTVRRQWKPGFVVGAAAGGVLGLLIAFGAGEDDASIGESAGSLFLMSTFSAFYGFAGTLVGGLFKREGWETVQGGPGNATTSTLLVGPRTMPNGNSGFVLGAKLQF